MVLLYEIQFLLFHNNPIKHSEPNSVLPFFSPNLQDVNDVLAALDHVIEKGLADPSKISVVGGSHGGFLTTHLIGQVYQFPYMPPSLWFLCTHFSQPLFNKHLWALIRKAGQACLSYRLLLDSSATISAGTR